MEFLVSKTIPVVNVRIKEGLRGLFSLGLCSKEQFVQMDYQDTLTALVDGFMQSDHSEDIENDILLCQCFSIDITKIKNEVSKYLRIIITEDCFNKLDRTACYFDPIEWAPQRVYSTYKLFYPSEIQNIMLVFCSTVMGTWFVGMTTISLFWLKLKKKGDLLDI